MGDGKAVRVQTLAETNLDVPSQYIQPLDTRPTATATATATTIPLIDLSDPHSKLDSIGGACREWGAFHVTGHSVPIKLIREMKSVTLSFFNEFSSDTKLQYSCDPNFAASEGYGTRMLVSGGGDDDDDDDGGVLDWRDYFDHHTLPISRRNPSRWPHFPPNYRDTVTQYSDCMNVLAQELLGLISETLGLPSSSIKEAVDEFYQNITVSYYPPCPQPELTLGLQSHSDMGAITLLIQDEVSGLQVFKDGEWVTVQPLSDAIVVILADQTEIISNGVYRSAQHRAITNSDRARLSIATFHDPAKTVTISPASALLSESTPPRYRPVVYGDYVSSWYTKGPHGKRNIDALLL